MSEKGRSADPLGAPQADPGLWEQMTEALRQRDAARSELAALHARVTALADEWDRDAGESSEWLAALLWGAHELRRSLLRPNENGDNT